jgi:hypothetical protein
MSSLVSSATMSPSAPPSPATTAAQRASTAHVWSRLEMKTTAWKPSVFLPPSSLTIPGVTIIQEEDAMVVEPGALIGATSKQWRFTQNAAQPSLSPMLHLLIVALRSCPEFSKQKNTRNCCMNLDRVCFYY